ncbi:uncharacterized protein [Penaeus vannamei]|uniref:uncharacterized protein n=1 Tax=Penaeus vannamei TaxID=6689 RepID=UPI00387F71B1
MDGEELRRVQEFKYFAHKVPLRLNGEFHRRVIRPVMLYGRETVSMKKSEEKRMEVAEMRMLRWMCAVTREDKIRNEYIRGSTKVVEISKKIQKGRRRWYGHLLRREEDHAGRYTVEMEVQGRRKREDQEREGETVYEMTCRRITEEETEDRNQWKQLIHNIEMGES